MKHAIEYLEAELDSLKDAWRENTQELKDVYISKIIDVKEALCHLKKISERQDSTEISEQSNNKTLHTADVSDMYSAEKVLEMLESVDDIEDAKDMFRDNWIE